MLTVATQTVIVRRSPEHVRGRVLGVTTASINAALVGAFVAGGALVNQVGPRATVIGCGLAAAAVGAAFAAVIRPSRARTPDTVPLWVTR
jgi:MFS family permease